MNNFLTLGIFAHANAGKTTITEHLLYHSNIIDKIGRVDSGNTITDTMSIEQERGISVRSSLVTFEIGDKKIQLVDTPGHIDFSAEVERTISILDTAILVISGADGIEPQTYTIWKALKEKGVPIFIFINKMDRLGANYNNVIEDIKKELDSNVLPLIKINQQENQELTIENNTFEELLELVAGLDDLTLKLFFEDKNKLTEKWLNNRIKNLIQNKKLFPIIGGSSLKGIGIDILINCIDQYMKPFRDLDNQEFSAFVYLVRVDNYKRNLYTKILSGTINIRDNIQITNNKIEKIKSLYTIYGNNLISTDSASCGEIVVINGLNVNSGEIIGKQFNNKYIPIINPILVMQVEPINKCEIVELVESLRILTDEDSYLNVRYDKITDKIYINLMGLIQAEIIQELLDSRFNIKSIFSNPLVKHKEMPTIKGRGESSYTQFSAIEFEVTPLKKGSGLIYNSKLSTDYLHEKYQSQAEKLVQRYTKQGLYGWEITDAEISLINGKFNSAGSNPSHFNIIVPIALMRALKNSNMKILEPISYFKIITPTDTLTAVVQSLNSKGAIYEIEKEDKRKVVLVGEVTSKEIINYSTEIIKITSGRGAITSNLLRYGISRDQNVEMEYYGLDPRNETKFVKGEMKGSLEVFDTKIAKNKKASRSKFKRQQL